MTDSSLAGSSLGREVRRFWKDAAEMLAVRRQLAESELRSDLFSVRRLAMFVAVGGVAALTGVSVLAVVLGDALDRMLLASESGSFGWISLLLGTVLVIAGVAVGIASWQRFRREFLGMQDSLAEIREDLAWLREWVERDQDDS